MTWALVKRLIGGSVSTPEPAERPTTRRRETGKAGVAETAGDPFAAMMAETQARAKAADDQRKAAFRAHTARPLPPLTADGEAAIARARGAALALRHAWPPRRVATSLSFIGGEPVVPESFDWPMIHDRDGLLERLTFIAQIDCSAIPAGPARDLLPETGVLYFFAPMSGRFGPDAAHFVVRYLPGPVGKRWEPSTFPAVGTIAGDGRAPSPGKAYPKAEVELGWLVEPGEDEAAAQRGEGLPHAVAATIRAERAEAFFGPARTGPVLSRHGGDAAWLLEAGFPANRAMARTLRQSIQQFVHAELKSVEAMAAGTHSDEAAAFAARKALLDGLTVRAGKAFAGTDWNNANAAPALTGEERDRGRAFCAELLEFGFELPGLGVGGSRRDRDVAAGWMASAAVVGAQAALIADPAGEVAVLDPALLAAMARRHDARGHHLFGEATEVQTAAGENRERAVLLLELGRDEVTGWTVGEMGPMQWWIAPEDLAAGSFEHAWLTIEAC